MIFVILWHFVHLSLEETIGNSKTNSVISLAIYI